MPASLDARLLFAARTAYDIPAPSGTAMTANPSYDLANVAGFTGGLDDIDAAFVADARDGVVLSFRGTLSPADQDHRKTVLDWLNDADAVFVRDPTLPGLVHQGFHDTLSHLWPQLQGMLLDRVRAASATTPVYVTGHSKGGAVAYLAAMRCQAALAEATLRNPVIVRSFAAARPGDRDFAAAFDQTIPDALRYEYADDIVPHVPPENALRLALRDVPALPDLGDIEDGFVSPGTLRYLPRGSTPATPPEASSLDLKAKRIAGLLARLVELDFATIVKDHSIDPGSGYAQAIVGDETPLVA